MKSFTHFLSRCLLLWSREHTEPLGLSPPQCIIKPYEIFHTVAVRPDSVAWRLTCGQYKKWCGHGVAPCAKRQTVGLRTRRLGSVKGQEVFSSIPRADRFWTHPVAYARLPGAAATTRNGRPTTSIHLLPKSRTRCVSDFPFNAVPRHVDDLACNLLCIAVFIRDLQKNSKILRNYSIFPYQ
jgi:hypothetical protein